jgi:hypothetical protein
MSDIEFWEQWVGSVTRPVEQIKRRAKVTIRDSRRWITYPDEINGANVIVEMPVDAPTKSCDQGRTSSGRGLTGRAPGRLRCDPC